MQIDVYHHFTLDLGALARLDAIDTHLTQMESNIMANFDNLNASFETLKTAVTTELGELVTVVQELKDTLPKDAAAQAAADDLATRIQALSDAVTQTTTDNPDPGVVVVTPPAPPPPPRGGSR